MIEHPCDCGKFVADDEHHCWEHHVDEWVEEPFRVCGECFHVYATGKSLVDAYNAEIACPGEDWTPAPARVVADIFFCPLCIHDF